jgi:uncharacterized protein DUF4153
MRQAVGVWTVALALAALGTAVLFEAAAGINWAIWTLGAVAAIAIWARQVGVRVASASRPTLALAAALAAATPLTAADGVHALIACAVAALLAMAVLLAGEPRWSRLTLPFMLWAPIVAPLRALIEAIARAREVVAFAATSDNRAPLRGTALALPIVALFAVILANADPVLATLRDDLAETLARLAFVPRLAFFSAILVLGVGAGGLIVRGAVVRTPALAPWPAPRLGDVERLIVGGAVTAVLAAFLLLQLSYLFGNAPARVGSGITFAEYARRGFGELTAVATLCALLLILLERFATRGPRERWVRGAALAMILEVQVLLISALRRLWLYEQAYGFTTLRLYAHVYMIAVGAMMLLLAWELCRGLAPDRLARRAAGIGAIALLALTVWNHEAWIVRENVARYRRTGQLDAIYLSGLSPNAAPAIVASLPLLPDATADTFRGMLRWRYSATSLEPACRWFEWNVRRRQAADAVRAAGLVAEPVQLGPRACS